jgi:hypothetical protein
MDDYRDWAIAHPLPMAYIPAEESDAFLRTRREELGLTGMFDGADPDDVEALLTAIQIKCQVELYRQLVAVGYVEENALKQSLGSLSAAGYQAFKANAAQDPLAIANMRMLEDSLAK